MQRFILMASCALLIGLPMGAQAINGKRVNGVGVFTQWFSPFDINNPYDGMCPRGQIVKANIFDNQVTSWDTLYDSIGQYPAINGNCSLAVFFRWGVRVTIDRTTGRISPIAGTANNPGYLSIVNLNGPKVVRNLKQVDLHIDNSVHSGENNQLLDWPAGDWIYYEKPTYSAEVRRINYKTLADELVCTWPQKPRRFGLSLDGKVASNQGGACGNCVYQFPWNGKNIGAPGCNMIVSSGGTILAHYFGGCHDDIDICPFGSFNWQTPNPWLMPYQIRISTIEGWLGKQVSYNDCADLNRWAVNSDKWVLRQIGWNGQGMDIAKGCNQVMVNYIDKAAIIGNPYLPPANGATQPAPSPRNQWVNACAGDFYITGDATSPNSVKPNSYEDTLGVWHTVIPTSIATDGTTREVLDYGKISAGAQGIMVSFLRPISFTATAFECTGKIAIVRSGIGQTTLTSRELRPGSYMVRIDSGNQVLTKKVTIVK
jgi:hypothetical protein